MKAPTSKRNILLKCFFVHGISVCTIHHERPAYTKLQWNDVKVIVRQFRQPLLSSPSANSNYINYIKSAPPRLWSEERKQTFVVVFFLSKWTENQKIVKSSKSLLILLHWSMPQCLTGSATNPQSCSWQNPPDLKLLMKTCKAASFCSNSYHMLSSSHYWKSVGTAEVGQGACHVPAGTTTHMYWQPPRQHWLWSSRGAKADSAQNTGQFLI